MPIVIGHRGAMAYAPENSVSSFETALNMGVQVLELDVHLSKDEEVVVIHDDTVERTTNGRGNVREMTLDELKSLKLKNGERIPTMSEVLDMFRGKCTFNVELKVPDVTIPAYNIVTEKGLLSNVLFSSFDGPQLLELKMKDEASRIAFLCKDKKINMITISRSLKAESIHPKKKLVKPDVIEKAHANGLKVNVWVVNRPSAMERFIKMGVDGIITDKPDVLAEVLKEY